MKIGYARVSTQEQELGLQVDALEAAGCAEIYREKITGATRERPQLQALLEYLREVRPDQTGGENKLPRQVFH